MSKNNILHIKNLNCSHKNDQISFGIHHEENHGIPVLHEYLILRLNRFVSNSENIKSQTPNL